MSTMLQEQHTFLLLSPFLFNKSREKQNSAHSCIDVHDIDDVNEIQTQRRIQTLFKVCAMHEMGMTPDAERAKQRLRCMEQHTHFIISWKIPPI